MADSPHGRLRSARLGCGFASAATAAAAHGWNRNTYASNENGHAPFSCGRAAAYAAAFGVEAVWLLAGLGPRRSPLGPGVGPVLGSVGQGTHGEVRPWARPRGCGGWAALRPAAESLALLVDGDGVTPLASRGSLIYFAADLRPATEALVGRLAVLETEDDALRVAYVCRRQGVYHPADLSDGAEGAASVRWAAAVTAIVPPVRIGDLRGRAA